MQLHHLTAREWDALAADSEFQALLQSRRRFTVPATLFAFAFFLALPISIAVAPPYMSQPILGPLTRAFAFGLLQFVMAWVLLALYMREARKFDDASDEIAKRVHAEFAS